MLLIASLKTFIGSSLDFDLILSNPPFYFANKVLKSKNPSIMASKYITESNLKKWIINIILYLKIKLLKKRGTILIKQTTDKHKNLDLKKILKDLYKMEIRNLLVEGGDILTKNFLQKKLFNEFYMFRSSKKLSKNKKHINFTSFSILNTKYNKHKINSKLATDKLTIYKN